MRKSLLLIPLIIVACKKEANVAENKDKDSMVITEQPNPASKVDSNDVIKKDSAIDNSSGSGNNEPVRVGAMRSEKDGKIIRTADASQLPFTLGEEFTKDNQELILKITNYNRPNIKASISTNEKNFNIRFNQIRLPNGDYDGPFGRDISHEILGKGELWLIIGKSNMASGNTKGNFNVSIE